MIGGLENGSRIWNTSSIGSVKVNRVRPQVSNNMPRWRFTSLLFVVALLAQIASPLARGAIMGAAGERGAAHCAAMQTDEASATPADAAPRAITDQAPGSGDERHDHHCCPLCAGGTGAPPVLRSSALVVVAPWTASTRLVYSADARPVLSLRLNRGALARAPPSFL
jgi:hypothetical protein